MSTTLVATLAIGGLITFGLRWGLIALVDAIELPEALKAALRFVPVAVFAAIVGPMVLVVDGEIAFLPGNIRLAAALVAVVTAWATRNVLYTLIAGMGTLWGLQFLLA
ncbi:AzlD domain-containing protein [uncultured Salinisphaera sp.]|uniref:AzlD domain-containing protein n=1 Tax=uncultured Salinisphaera sp. TaxID=359372 RepID=UPI0032B26460|tara:strand:+ start:2205 stop:2528 length:324 start_codon:yes stop_codon:yes gene_type:complete